MRRKRINPLETMTSQSHSLENLDQSKKVGCGIEK
jgi:hypothetical protein